MEVLELNYHGHNDRAITDLNHMLFGRLVYRNYRGRRYVTYVPGMLDSVPHYRPSTSTVYIPPEYREKIHLQALENSGTISLKSKMVDINKSELFTAEEYWREVVSEQNLPIRKQKKSRWE